MAKVTKTKNMPKERTVRAKAGGKERVQRRKKGMLMIPKSID